MKFTLTFDGELPPNGDTRQKWAIRKQFTPQLKELWDTHPALLAAERHRLIPAASGFTMMDVHHSAPLAQNRSTPPGESIDLCIPINKFGKKFLPIVRDSYALRCGLKIIFLRKEPPGKVYQGGDLDNRLKTLFDALEVPRHAEQVVADDVVDDPMCCLLENDALITACSIETHTLLARPEASKFEARLLIEVDVRVSQAKIYNSIFMGD